MFPLFHRQRQSSGVALLLVLLTTAVALHWPNPANAVQPHPVTAAWQKVRAAGSYHFTSDVTQVTMPTTTVTNVGRSSRTAEIHLQGQTDLRQRTMEMQIWSAGGSVLQDASAIGVKVVDGQTFVRQGQGEWQEKPDFSVDSLAPQGDFMAYLSALRDVEAHAPEQRGGIAFTRYSFTIDGPVFAAYTHRQLEQTLRAKGELPPHVQLEIPRYYQEMTGDGELWIGADGLPLRQVLHLQFPPQKNEQVQAQIVVDFSNYGLPVLSPWALLRAGDLAGLWAHLPALPATLATFLPPALLLLTALLGMGLMLYHRRRRILETALAVAVIISMVVGPVLTTITHVRFFDAQSAKAAAYEEKQTAADQERDLQAALGTVKFNPQQNPLESSAVRSDDWAMAKQSPNRSSAQAPHLQAALPTDNGVDTDGDTLSDFIEERVGTSLIISDTDSDSLPDNLEVHGFTFGGKQWYLNPNALDSNNDGQGDALEWGMNANGTRLTTPQDTDADGTPDLFDNDNDNDGVTDRRDLSPYVANPTTFGESTPLQLRLDNLTANKPAFVEFQLRPQDPKHLWFAFNVLDWPQESAGQMQDVDNKTYADVATAQARVPDAAENNGDLKLFPMLEIRMPSAGANLPPQSDLTPFNITVNNFTADGATKVAYVPLTLVKDEASGQRVAFSGQMRYLPTGAWPTPHDVRLVWGVQALVDRACDPQNAQEVAQGCQPDGYIHNVPQLLQTYYDAWTLTGLTVREEHGTTMGLIYEDPAVDPNKKDDVALWALSFVLDHHFALARDEDNNGQRDLTVNEIANRFDRTRNAAYTEDQRFAVPNILRVAQQNYPTLDQAVAATTMTETVKLLNTAFAPAVTTDRAIKPLILFAQENSGRNLTLDVLRAGGGYVSQSGAVVTFNMAPTGQPAQTVAVTAGIKWTAYCVPDSGALTWQSCPADLYWETLEQRYAGSPALPGETDHTFIEGSLHLTQLYYVGFTNGFYGLVQQGTQVVAPPPGLNNAATTTQRIRRDLGQASALLLLSTEAFARALIENINPDPLRDVDNRIRTGKYAALLRNDLKEDGRYWQNFMDKWRRNRDLYQSPSELDRRVINSHSRAVKSLTVLRTTPLAVAGVTMMVVSQIYNLIPDAPSSGRAAVSALTAAVSLGINVALPIIQTSRIARLNGSLLSVLTRASMVDKIGKIGGGVGLALALGVTWGVFIYNAASSGYAAGSPEINQAFAGAVAATIIILLTTLLASTVIGGIIAAIIAVIDLILTAICEAGADSLRSVPGLSGSCFTLGAGAIKVLTYLIYNYDSMINTDRADLVVMGEADINLADPSKGYVAGNTLSVNLPITTTIVHKNPDPSNGVLINGFLYLFSAANLRSSTYQYSLSAPDKQDIVVARDQMSNAWAVRERNAEEGGKYVATTMYRGQASTNPPAPVTGIPLQAGINRPAEFYFNMGYAIPAYECWMMPLPMIPFVPPIPVCYTRELAGAHSTKMDNIKFDIFPATLDGFMSVTSNGDGGLRLDWDVGFPSLKDADGDGLLSTVYRGLDPNDNSVDADNDGLSDTYELEHRQGGFVLSPVSCDSDLDGLTDEQEMGLNSDPGVADSDNDGLLDGQEVWHRIYTVTTVNNQTTCTATANWTGGWDVRINATSAFVVHVSSDPLVADSDGDGLSDLAEKQLAESTCTAQEVANGRTCEGNPLKPVDSQNRPFHPTVPNTPPLALVLATDDFDGYLAPGQTLRYTTTVIANAPMAPGVLDILSPAPPFAGQPAPQPLPFNSLTFSGSQTMTAPSNLTVQAGSATQAVVLSSRARTRLASSSGAAWTFDPVALEPALGGFTTPLVARNTGLTANRPDRTDNYLLTSLLASAATTGGAGDVQAYNLPGGATRALEADNLNKNILRGASAPRSATNNRGDSLVVWDQVENCRVLNITLLTIVTAGADNGTSGIEPFITVRDSASNQEVRVWSWTSVRSVDLGGGTYAQGFPVTVNVCGDYTLTMWESDGNGDESVGAIARTQATDLNSTVTFEGAGHRIAIDVNTPYRDQYTVAGALVGADGNIKQRVAFPAPSPLTGAVTERRSFNPVVASAGANFMVGYEHRTNNGIQYFVTQPVAADGTPGTPTRVAMPVSAPPFDTQSRLAHHLAWLGAGYRALFNTGSGSLSSLDYDTNGLYTSTAFTTVATDSTTALTPPSLTWDPISGRWALAYIRNDTTVKLNRYVNAAAVTPDASITFTSLYKRVELAWNPLNRGWLFQGQLTDDRQVFVALDSDLVQRATNATQTSWTGANPAGIALACPAVTALPVLDLRMEELPGATSFIDSSGRGNTAVCGSASQCPAAGAPGGVYANGTAIGGGPQGAASDYALTFNSNQYLRVPNNAMLAFDANRSFTWLGWVKTGVGSPIMRKGLGGANDLLLSITTDSGRLRMGFGNVNSNTLTATGPDLRDNGWHQVGVTLDRTTNTATLYVDGTARGSGTFMGSFVTNDDLFIGSSNVAGYIGAMDNLQIYHSALAADTISALYSRTQQAYCVGSSPTQTGNGVQWAKLVVRQPDLRGGAITVSNSLNLTVDGDQPTASLTSLPTLATVQGGSSAAPRIFVIGGTASDPTSTIAQVEVSVNNGAWQLANGGESWTFALSLTDGEYTIRTRATDAVGTVGAPSAAITLFADGTVPQMSVSTHLATGVRPIRRIDARYNLFLQGAASDPVTAGSLGQQSNVVGYVQLFNEQGQAVTEPQRVERNPDTSWQLFYRFPDGEKAPAGRYFIELQATDRVGNQFEQRLANGLVIDGLGPVATLTQTNVNSGAVANIITNTVTIGGQISETLGVSSANLNFTPLQQVLPYSTTVLLLDLEEQSPGTTVAGRMPVELFTDSSTQFNHALCISGTPCPLDSVAGKVGRAISFNGNQALRVRNHPTLHFDANSSFSWQVWVKTTSTLPTNPIMRKGLGGTADLMLSINSGGQAEMGFGAITSSSRLFAGPNLRDDQWHQIVVTLNRPNNRAELYVDGVSYGGGTFPGNFTTPDDLLIGSGNFQGFVGTLDQIAIFRHALNGAEVQALYQSASRPLYPATVTGDSWTRQVPTGLEGIYQIDLPTVDSVSNELANGNLWRGIIDTTNPRVSLTGRATGQSYLDTATNTQRYEITYTCRAEDFHLAEASFTCADNSQRPPVKSFNSDPLLKQQFPDLTLLTALVNTYTVWAASPTPTGSLTACDASGHCTTATATTSTGSAATAATETMVQAAAVPGAPQAVIVDPTQGSALAGGGELAVTIAAEAANGLKEVQLLVDGQVATQFTFNHADNVHNVLRTVIIAMPAPGAHGLTVAASDWSGTQQVDPTPVRITIQSGAPTVTIDTANLNNADSYGAGSNVYRLHGKVNDLTLDTVQVRVGDQPYVSAPVVNGEWRIAYPILNTGGAVTIAVQASNAAGQSGKVSNPVTLDETGGQPIDTHLVETPPSPSGEHVSFRFKGSTLGDVELLIGQCSLDGSAFVPCSSPQEYRGLSAGEHTWRVRAVDSQGFVDATPAIHTWTVQGSGPLTQIEEMPAATTGERRARFVFKATTLGDSEALYDCQLDGAAYAPCTSPQEYSGLADGAHSFQVRARSRQGGEAGTPNRFTWRITNSAPVAQDGAATVAVNSTVNLTLSASDADRLRFQLVTKPKQGVLLGLPPNLTYQPNSGYVGTDSFTFRANDGEFDSNVATVNLSIEGSLPTPTPTHTPVGPTPTPTMTPTPTNTPTRTLIGSCGGYDVYSNGPGQYTATDWSGAIIVGTAGADRLRGALGADLMLGLGGADKLEGKGGPDLLCGGEGDDVLVGDKENDLLDGGPGNDKLNSNRGWHDVVIGGDGDDQISDPDGVASLSGGVGADTVSLVLDKQWRNANSQPSFSGLAAGYGNDKVNLVIAGRDSILLDISGDERDNPASPLEGSADILRLRGRVATGSTVIKFEQQDVRPAEVQTSEAEIEVAQVIQEWLAGGEWVATEAEVDPVAETINLYLPLLAINAAASSEALSNGSMVSELPTFTIAPGVTDPPALPSTVVLTATTVVTTTSMLSPMEELSIPVTGDTPSTGAAETAAAGTFGQRIFLPQVNH